MAGSAKRRRILAIVATDSTYHLIEQGGQAVWVGKCIHCNRRLTITAAGEPVSRATIEHIVPRARGGTDDLANLALACAGCNHEKGVRHDHKRGDDMRLNEVIARLQSRRQERWRQAEGEG